MNKLLLAAFLVILATTCVFSQDQLSVSFTKSTAGELIMTVKGHISPVTINVGDKEIVLQVGESEVNLTKLGISDLTEVSVEETDTAAGGETAAADIQAPIPPISPFINPNPPLTTPF
jgi:hypothetical protein